MKSEKHTFSQDLHDELQKSKDETSLISIQAVCTVGIAAGLGYTISGIASDGLSISHGISSVLAGACLITRTLAVGFLALLRQSKNRDSS